MFGEGGSVIPTDYVLAYDFNSNLLDKSTNSNNGTLIGGLTYVLNRKGNANSAISLTGTASGFKTSSNLNLSGTDKISISFWVKSTQTNLAVIFEHSINYNNNNGFSFNINGTVKQSFGTSHPPINSKFTNNIIPPTWTHYCFLVDRSLISPSEITVYINGVIDYWTLFINNDLSGNFGNQTLYFGQRNGNTFPFSGGLDDYKIYDRLLSETEITALYNE